MPYRRNQHFPWKLLRKFLAKAVILFLLVFGGVVALFEAFFMKDLQEAFPGVDWGSLLQIILFINIGAATVVFVGLLAFVFFELLMPLGVLFSRVKALDQKNYDLDQDEDDLVQNEPGEWGDIETAVEHIREELRRSRRKHERNKLGFHTVLSAVPEGIFAVDNESKPRFYNEAFLELFKLNRDEMQDARLVQIIRSPEVLDAFKVVRTSGEVRRVELSLEGPGVPVRHFQVMVAPLWELKPGDGAPTGAVSIFQDVTELKKLAQIRIDFVANVSHELRTPLTSVKGYAQTLLEDIKARRFEQGEKYLEVVTRNLDRLLELVNDLMDLSSIESGLKISKENISTRSVTEPILAQVESMKQAKGIFITAQYDVESVFGDEARLQQVLLNLVQNAIQYIPSGKKIEITWRRNAGGVELSVKDNGPGIEPQHLGRIFERFYRVDKARTKESGGTGLGLAIVKHITQRHGGTSRVLSQLNQGTEFMCTFPDKMD